MDHMYIDHQQQHKQVYYLDRDYDDFLNEYISKTQSNNFKYRFYLPKIANGKSNGIIILVESIILTMKRERE